eukprot:9058101-Prorocentrum_lima.AAC.1
MRTSNTKIPFDFRKWISRLVALLTMRPPSALKWTSFPALVSVETANKGLFTAATWNLILHRCCSR